MQDRLTEPSPRPTPVRSAAAQARLAGAGSRRHGGAPGNLDLLQLQSLVGNHAVTGLLVTTAASTVQRCGEHSCPCATEARTGTEAAEGASVQRESRPVGHPDPGPDAPLAVQRDFLSDAWRGLTAAGPAVVRAAQLITRVMANPAQLPAVLGAIAWEEIPEAAKGPLIDEVLRACLAAARAVEIPGPPGLPIGTILKHVAIGALERALSYPTGLKVRVADRMAQVVLRPSPDFAIGFLTGLVSGLWDGITGPFVLLWDLVKIGYEIEAAQLRRQADDLRLMSSLVHSEARAALSRDVHATLDRVGAQISTLMAQLTSGRADPRAILTLIETLVNAALRGVESLGASLADALLRFVTRPDRQLGEGVGWVAGTATFEVLLLVLTEGGYTAVKEAVSGLRIVMRMAEAGAQAAEAIAPVRAALAAFRAFAASNRALAPLVESVEELLSLLVRYLRFSYGLGPAGGAARAGERAAGVGERGASREIRVADTALGETHEITILADGRLIRCSDQCAELVQSLITRGRALAASRMPEESARLVREAELIAAEAKAIKGNRALTDAQRTAQEEALLRRAGSLERQTASAEREALLRVVSPARQRTVNCRKLATANPKVTALRQFDAQLTQLEQEIQKTSDLLASDPSMRELVAEEVQLLEKQGRAIEDEMRRLAPSSGSVAAPFDVTAFEKSLVNLSSGERVARVGPEAERQAARHGFVRDRRLSTLNNRDVYVRSSDGHLFSVDTQHGRFEHCAPNGNHVTETNFDLVDIPDSQSADHRLRVN